MTWLLCENTLRKTSSSFVVRKPLTTIGRAKGNDLVLDDPMLSPTHAHLVRQGDAFTLSQMTRTSEIYVNGRRVRKAALSVGDKVMLGAWQLTFSDGEPTEEAGQAGADLSMAILQKLVGLSEEIMRDQPPKRLFRALLVGLVELTRAQKGILILLKDGERHQIAAHNVDDDAFDLSKVSDSIVDKVIKTGDPLLLSDAMSDSRFGRAQSVVDLRLSSVMCVPLLYRRDLIGVIYLGNDQITDLFTDSDLDLLKVYAAQAALLVHHALELNELRLENRNLRNQLLAASQGEMLGTCTAMKRLFKVIRRVAPTDLSVLVLGETGTGKELVAREIHGLSDRRNKPLVAINCGAIPENLLESELFGHKKGSFTGAIADKTGKVEAANGGTLFLDEIAEMPMNLQVKLLRVLQDRTIERVGELRPRPVDIRVVAATNKDIEELIASGEFREDLYYRLAEMTVALPPLRDRHEDIELLAKHFLNKYRKQYEAKARGFTNQGLLAMKNYAWPGNVRELESRVKKALIMSDRSLLNHDDLGLSPTEKRALKPLVDAQEDWKIEYIRQALELNNWNKAATARTLGVDARTIFRYIEKFEE